MIGWPRQEDRAGGRSARQRGALPRRAVYSAGAPTTATKAWAARRGRLRAPSPSCRQTAAAQHRPLEATLATDSGFFIPEELARCRTEMHGDEGVAWLARLPAIVGDCARRWSLALAGPYPNLSYNYVAPATLPDGSAAVLKVCYLDHEFYTEAEALRLYDGRGCTRLLAADLERGAMLIERATPGISLNSVGDEAEVASIAASVMRRLWRPLPRQHSLPSVDTWMTNMERRFPALRQKAPLFAWDQVERALRLYRELAASAEEPVLLHGDLHQGNILSARREPWLAIDPKGISGPPIWETGPLLLNAVDDDTPTADGRRILERMVARLSEALTVGRDELRAWGYVRAVLSAYWTVEDNGQEWEGALRCAQLLSE